MSLIAFNLGLPKSGSSTLQNAIVRSGIPSVHWYTKTVDKYVGREMYNRYWENQNLLADFPGIQAVTQSDLLTSQLSFWPQMDPAMIRVIAKQNPACKFFLTIRSPDKIARSMDRWGNYMERLYKIGAPGLPPNQATNEARVARWIGAHYSNIKLLFDNSDKLVTFEIDDPDAPNIVGNALGREILWWGQSNKTTENSNLGYV